jgi:drug/metabolite transporter (DMT)-like permease
MLGARGASSLGVGVACLAISILSLGSNWPILKMALRWSSPLWITEGRLLVSAVLYALALLVQGRLRWPPRSEWRILIIIGVFQNAVMVSLVTVGVAHVGAGRAAVLVYSMPIWIIPGAVLWLHERVSRPQLLGLGIGILGILVLFNPIGFDWSNGSVVLGNACVLLGSLSWSVSILGVRGHRWQVDVLEIMPFQTLLAALLVLPAAGIVEGWRPAFDWTPELIWTFPYICMMGLFLPFWLIVEAGRRLPAIQISLAQLATPVIGMIAAALWINEVPTADNIVGLVLIIVGVAVATIFGARAMRPAEHDQSSPGITSSRTTTPSSSGRGAG